MQTRPADRLPTDRPFTIALARARGVSRDVLRGSRFSLLHRGVYVDASVPLTLRVRLLGLLLVLPRDAVVSHVSAARMWGFEPNAGEELHASTNTALRCRLPGVRLQRRSGRLHPVRVQGMPTTGAERTVVDCATMLGVVRLVQLAEHLVQRGATSLEALEAYCHRRHLDGVVRARRVLPLVRSGVESPMETLLRLMLVLARLPESEVNVEIRDDEGRFVARVDLLYRRWKVVVEYDGRHHETDRRQWARATGVVARRSRLWATGCWSSPPPTSPRPGRCRGACTPHSWPAATSDRTRC